MERNGDVLAEINNYHPERYQISINNFDVVESKMCKDDVSKSLFCDVAESLKINGGFQVQNKDKISLKLEKQCLDLLTCKKTNFSDSDERMLLPEWRNAVDLYDFSSNNTMSLNTFISKDSFINGKQVLAASNTFPIDNCFSSTNNVDASESSLDLCDSLPHTFEESSSSSIEEIFRPTISNPDEAKARYIAKLQRISANTSETLQPNSNNPSEQPSSQHKLIPDSPAKSSVSCQKKDRVMPELLPTLICLDDDDSVSNCKADSPAVVNVADSPEMPKLTPFSAENEEVFRIKKESLEDNRLRTPESKSVKVHSLSDPKSISCKGVDLKTCARQLFPDSVAENAMICMDSRLSPKRDEHDNSTGFSFSASFTDSKTAKDAKLNGIQKHVKAVSLTDEVFSKSDSEAENSESENSDSIISLVSSSRGEKGDNIDNSINSVRQPQIKLRRIPLDQCSSLHSSEKLSSTKNLPSAEKITFEHCLLSNASDDSNSLMSQPECDDNSSNEAPEIEEIEGIRFFRFRSKRDMEEFNRKPMEGEIDVDMIVPTKTTDITQIKGWRNKYFAPDSQFHYPQSDDGNSRDESSQNAKSVPMPVNSTETKCLDFRNCLKENKPQHDLTMPVPSIGYVTTKSEDFKIGVAKMLREEKPLNVMSAFVSKDLDDFLLNSSKLNVSLLEKVNPNIVPIPPDASILGLGKLRKPDYELNTLAALKRRNMLNKLKEGNQPPVPPAAVSDDDSVIHLSSSDESSSDDDIPVASLNRGKKRAAVSKLKKPSAIGAMKRRRSDTSGDGSQRVVLRLTKESIGVADGYKVSDISCEKQNSEDESLSSSSSSSSSEESSEAEELPDVFKTSADGASPIIKETIFLKETEPKLLEEFLNNLNTLGTSKDVAMLVKSNQSYFSKGPVLNAEMCSEALESLMTNKEFVDSKNKHTPKKKLKAWQKYLPKKLSKIQQQKISKVSTVLKAKIESCQLTNLKDKNTKAISIPKVQPMTPKTFKSGDQEVNNSKEISKQKNLTSSEQISTNDKLSTQANSDIKKDLNSEIPKSEIVPKVRKRRSRSAIELSDPLAIIERGKRSIRLPARYLDSAMLPAGSGSEWVSPIFVEDEKKSRKQLLDVLDKITPSSEDSPNAEKKGRKHLLDVLDKLTPNKEPVKTDAVKKDTQTLSSSDQQTVKKAPEENIQPIKTIKRQMKMPIVVPKKLKSDNVEDIMKKSEEISQNQKSCILSPSVQIYLPSCLCTPCSRTACYKKHSKEFVCFSDHTKKQTKLVLSESTIINSKKSPVSACPTVPDTILTSSVPTASVKGPEIESSELYQPDSSSISPILKLVKEGEIINKSTENLQPSLLTKLPVQNVSNTNLVNSDGSKKVLFILPYNASSVLKNTSVPILPKDGPNSSPTGQLLNPELRIKPQILARKVAPETPLTSSPNLLHSSTRILLPGPVVSSAPNASPVVFKLQDNQKSSLPVLYNSSQASPVLQGQSVNVPEKLMPQTISSPQAASPQMLMTAYNVGGNVILCQTIRNDAENKSSPLNILNSNASSQTANGSAVSFKTSEVSAQSNPNTPAMQNTSLISDISQQTDKAVVLKTPPKKQTERRRKSPLSKRVFKESPENVNTLSDSEVDIDTVDEKFNPKAELKKQLLNNESDFSDTECEEIYSADMDKLILNGLHKSIAERKKRLFIKKWFEKLKATDPLLQTANNCPEFVKRAFYAVSKLKTKELALRQAKRIARLQNAILLEKLTCQLKEIHDIDVRNRAKRRLVSVLANDWKYYNHQKETFLLSSAESEKTKLSSPQQMDIDVSVPAMEIAESQNVVSRQMDFEVVENYNVNVLGMPHFEIDSKDTEQPHVQLRILEMPMDEQEIVTIEEMGNEVKLKETLQNDALQTADVQNIAEIDLSVPGVVDGNASDDDLLIIDLDEKKETNSSDKAFPQKDTTSAKQPTKNPPPPMRKFPGIVPLYPPEYYKKDDPFVLDLSKFSKEYSTSNKSSCDVEEIKKSSMAIPENKSVNAQEAPSSTNIKIIDPVQVALDQYNRLSAGRRSYQPLNLKVPHVTNEELLSFRNPIHRSCKDVKLLHGIGADTSEDVTPETVVLNVPKPSQRIIQEEIIISDSDEEPMDLKETPVCKISALQSGSDNVTITDSLQNLDKRS